MAPAGGPSSGDATEYILSELTRRLNEVASRLESGLMRLDQVYVRRDVYEQWMKTSDEIHKNMDNGVEAAIDTSRANEKLLGDRITKLEEARTWLFRLTVGAMTSAVGSAIVALIVATRRK